MGFIKNYYFEEINENYRNKNLDYDYCEFQSFYQWVELANDTHTKKTDEKNNIEPNDPHYLPF